MKVQSDGLRDTLFSLLAVKRQINARVDKTATTEMDRFISGPRLLVRLIPGNMFVAMFGSRELEGSNQCKWCNLIQVNLDDGAPTMYYLYLRRARRVG